jgi:hypothetical protein
MDTNKEDAVELMAEAKEWMDVWNRSAAYAIKEEIHGKWQ